MISFTECTFIVALSAARSTLRPGTIYSVHIHDAIRSSSLHSRLARRLHHRSGPKWRHGLPSRNGAQLALIDSAFKRVATDLRIHRAATVDGTRPQCSPHYKCELSISCIGDRLARIRSSGDRCRIFRSLHRPGPQQVGDHLRADRLRWSHPACPHRRRDSGHSAPLASCRLQLRIFRQCPTLVHPAINLCS
jgi:hypothetical protein